jgi:membrane protease YdiL (CAAX protease family)
MHVQELSPAVNHAPIVIQVSPSRIIYKAVTEVVAVVAATVFVNVMAQRILMSLANHSMRVLTPMAETSVPQYIKAVVIVAPVMEEILFRGICQSSIQLTQSFQNRFISLPSAADLEKQKILRIRCSALFFGLAHLYGHTSAKSALIQCSVATLVGVAYGHLKEKYQTISIGILAHGIHNALICLALINQETVAMPILICSSFALDFFWYKLGTAKEVTQSVAPLIAQKA